jgi:hypothetical protein
MNKQPVNNSGQGGNEHHNMMKSRQTYSKEIKVAHLVGKHLQTLKKKEREEAGRSGQYKEKEIGGGREKK